MPSDAAGERAGEADRRLEGRAVRRGLERSSTEETRARPGAVRHPTATMSDEASMTSATGTQILRSAALGVMAFSTRLTAENATTSQIGHGAGRSPGRRRPARDRTTIVATPRIAAWTAAPTRSAAGNRPGYLPPMAYAPHG